MSTAVTRPFDNVIPPELAADTQAVIDMLMTGKPLDPDVARRIRERGDEIRERIFNEHGLLDIGVPAIRELRDFMKYILDANVAFKWEVPEPDMDKALRLRDGFRAGIHDLLAPDFFPVEVGHALARAERQKRIRPPDGWAAWLAIMTDKPVLLPRFALMPRAYAIASAAQHGVYDCVYIALAEWENCELVTADNALFTKFRAQFPFIIPLASLP